MKELLLLIKKYLLLSEPLVLVMVIESFGSTPRGSGALMLVGKGADSAPVRLWGSIGGGLVEHLAIKEAASLLQTNGAFSKKYQLRQEEAAAFGAACGGEVSVFSRSLFAAETGLLQTIEKGIARFSKNKPAWLVLRDFTASPGILEILEAGESQTSSINNSAVEAKSWFALPLVSCGFVYVFGGGHVAQELVPLLSRLDFRCIVFDDRKEFASRKLFPKAEKVILGDFEDIGKNLTLGETDYAVILTRGHLWDLEAWAFTLNSPAAYIGIIGSKTKHEFVRAQLLERGFAPEEINAPRVHAPIGIDINSETPAEIAVSIAAELVQTRARIKNGK